MPLHYPAVTSIPRPYDLSTPDMTYHGIFFGPPRSGKSVIRPDAVLPQLSEAASSFPPSEAAPTGDEA